MYDRKGISYFRGSEEDVLGRVLDAARSVTGDLIVKITRDCPLVDHRHIDRVIELFYSRNSGRSCSFYPDYLVNFFLKSFLNGHR